MSKHGTGGPGVSGDRTGDGSRDGRAPDGSNHEGSVIDMDCDEAVHQLYHYLDGELTDERRREIAQHLDLCEPCAGAAGFEAELRQVIANHCRDRVPDSLIRRIAEAIHEEERRHSRTS
jgi:mycothiol system anti-sigma-R factor